MSNNAGLISLVVAVGLGLGLAVYRFFNNPNHDESEYHYHQRRNRSPPPRPRRRWPPSRSPSPERRNLRAISPAPVSHGTQENLPSCSTPGSTNRRSRKTENCEICKRAMPNSTISLKCGHVFHDECYTVWRYAVVSHNPQARLCPSCQNLPA